MKGEVEETCGHDPGVTGVQAELACKAPLKDDPFEDGLLAFSPSPSMFPPLWFPPSRSARPVVTCGDVCPAPGRGPLRRVEATSCAHQARGARALNEAPSLGPGASRRNCTARGRQRSSWRHRAWADPCAASNQWRNSRQVTLRPWALVSPEGVDSWISPRPHPTSTF